MKPQIAIGIPVAVYSAPAMVQHSVYLFPSQWSLMIFSELINKTLRQCENTGSSILIEWGLGSLTLDEEHKTPSCHMHTQFMYALKVIILEDPYGNAIKLQLHVKPVSCASICSDDDDATDIDNSMMEKTRPCTKAVKGSQVMSTPKLQQEGLQNLNLSEIELFSQNWASISPILPPKRPPKGQNFCSHENLKGLQKKPISDDVNLDSSASVLTCLLVF
ncbi:hypothetical protein QQP08_001912 [Theobroma cacao]|nr:hypothetical protein QQP08_001912 [Theobroma cacao]